MTSMRAPLAMVANAGEPADQPLASALPRDVVAFKARRDDCDRFRGEAADDEARAAELARKLEQSCTGSDAALKALRRTYAGNATVLSALADYEDVIE